MRISLRTAFASFPFRLGLPAICLAAALSAPPAEAARISKARFCAMEVATLENRVANERMPRWPRRYRYFETERGWIVSDADRGEKFLFGVAESIESPFYLHVGLFSLPGRHRLIDFDRHYDECIAVGLAQAKRCIAETFVELARERLCGDDAAPESSR